MYDDDLITRAIQENHRDYDENISSHRAHCYDGPISSVPAIESADPTTEADNGTSTSPGANKETGDSMDRPTPQDSGLIPWSALPLSASFNHVKSPYLPSAASFSHWEVDGEERL